MAGTDGDAEGDRTTRAGNALWILRASALILLVAGFTESVARGTAPVSVRTPAGVAFLGGIACAVASIYLGIYLQRERD